MDRGFELAGMSPLWMCESDRACREVLRYRWPGVKIYPDMRTLGVNGMESPTILCGGTPCQGFSVAGLRGSMEDDRSNLCLDFIKIANELDVRYVLWENVPGVLSQSDNAFGCFIAGLAGSDAPLIPPRDIRRWRQGRSGEYFSWPNAGMVVGSKRSVAWRVLDTQFFGCAQRRKRVFVVASAGNQSCFQILFERKSMRGDNPKSRGSWQDIAPTLEGRARSCGLSTDFALNGGIVESETVHCIAGHQSEVGDPTTDNYVVAIRTAQTSSNGWGIDESGSSYTLDGALGQAVAFRTSGNCGPFEQGDKTAALNCATDPNQNIICFQERIARNSHGGPSEIIPTLQSESTGDSKPLVGGSFGVRRLMPVETETLQGFPRDWTKYATDEKTGLVYEQADAPRYRQTGNAVSVPVVNFIARRINKFIASREANADFS